MIKDILLKIGLTEGEAEVYEALLDLGQSSTGRITKEAHIGSSKVYEVLQRLVNKGLASYVMKEGVRFYDATPPERLIDFLEQKRENLRHSQEEINDVLPSLKSKRKNIKETNKTIVYTGIQGPKIVLKETIEAGRKGEKLYGFGTDEDPYKDYLPADIEHHFRDQKRYRIKWYLLFSNKWKSSKKYQAPLQEARYLPESSTLPIRTMIYGNKVAIVDFHKPFTTIIIENKEIAESYKKHFNMLWKLAKKK
jgi:HTH-type transcriptional regulator, sugar sensing transcriptional regulator